MPDQRRHDGPARILFLSHVATLGGGERSLLDLLQAMDLQRFTCRVVLPGEGELSQSLAAIEVPSYRCASLRRLHRSRSLFRLAWQAREVVRGSRALRQLVKRYRPHLVHANSTTAALYACALPRSLPCPVLWHLRDLSVLPWLGRRLARRCARIVVPSQACHRLAETLVDPAKIALVSNGIHLEPPAVDRAGLRRELRVGDRPMIVVIGQLAPWKGHHVAIEVARLLRDQNLSPRFLLIGDDRFQDHPDAQDSLRQRVRELGLLEVVHLLGYRTDIASILGAADLLLHPAYPEPFGRVVVEGMAAGLPVVAFHGDHGPAEILRDGIDGFLVTPRTPEALAAAVSKLLADRGLRQSLGAAAKERAAARYGRALMAQRMATLYGALIPEKVAAVEGPRA